MTSRVLMIALRYPPYSGVGSIRTLKFLKYLPAQGWSGDVLTGSVPEGPGVWSREPAAEGPGWTYRLSYPVPASRAAGLLPPDEHALFVPRAFQAAGRELESRRYRVLYASGMPWSGLLAAVALKFRWGIPVVVDLRDPWVHLTDSRFGPLRKRVDLRLERATLAAADRIVVTADGLRHELLRRYPNLKPSSIVVITNGYDEDDFQPVAPVRRSGLHILHAGSFYGSKGPAEIFEALAAWTARHPHRRGRVVLRLLGGTRARDRELAVQMGVDSMVEFLDPVPHRQAVQELQRADILVGVDYRPDSARLRVLAKTFEYMRSGKPVLFLSSGGSTERVLAPCSRAVVVPKGDPLAAAEALERLASQAGSGHPFVLDAYTADFDRRALAAQLASTLEAAATGPSSRISAQSLTVPATMAPTE